MYAYVDDKYTVADNCIFAYYGGEESVRVPMTCGDDFHSLTKIGKGAFYGSEQMKRLTISGGIESVGDYAFKKCTQLEEVVVPATVLTCGERPFQSCRRLRQMKFFLDLMESEYEELLRHSFALADGRFLVDDHEEKLHYMHVIYEMIRDMGIRPVGIRPELESVFLVRNVNLNTGTESLSVSRNSMTFSGYYVGQNEKDTFVNAKDPRKSRCVDPITEGLCDMSMRLSENRVGMLEESVFLTFGKPERQGGIVHVMIDARKSFCFFQAGHAVVYGGERYYVYCRNYPTNDETYRYYRQEADIVRAGGGYVSPELRKSIFAKYKLITNF